MINTIKELNSSKQVKYGVIMSYFTVAFNILAGLIYTPWMVRQIGQADYGLYTLAISFISLFALDFGLGSAVSRFMSMYKAKDDIDGAKRFLGITCKLFLLITFIFFLVLIVIYLQIENVFLGLTLLEISKLKVIFCIAGLYSIIAFSFNPLNGILISNERFLFLKSIDLFHKILIVLLMVIALLNGFGLYALVIVNAFVGLLTIAIKLGYIMKFTDTEVDFSCRDKILLKEIFGFSAWTTVISISQRLILNITPTILGAFAGSVQIAIFSIGMTIEGYTWTIAQALNGLFLPKVTRMTISNKDMIEIENLMIKVGRIQLFVIGLIIVGFASMGKEFMVLWMGNNFSDTYYVALLLIVPCIISLTQEIAYTTLVALNEIKYRAMASLTVAVISIILSVILSKNYGAIGSAIAIFIGNVVGVIVIMNFVYYRVLKINIFRFFRECHIKMLIPLLLTYVLGLLMQSQFPVETLWLFMGKAGLLAVIYFLLMWFISFNLYERDLFLGLFKGASNKILNRR
ncbi:oligosaccharide flippase family protein [Dehalobacterium formicoaceticum]|uniref:Oligosaccharide flippase family protein n=1 Tax=Dehalobacterium formicoaceticum TaxID=51515 RepID=A0ABT1Y7Z3_9FIRM|nr:oligosaccharide flippase family protein [Dehalobacterium formicoaceticum]MCR6546205.1 oligosaccharide flippase family protein [Dehalobacterium formicoaceticum]